MTSDNNEILCSALLEAASDDPVGPRFRGAMQAIIPLIERLVAATCRKKSSSCGDADIRDTTQDILEKLMKNPPQHAPQKSAEATVLAWVKTVTINHLTDQWRRVSCRQPGSDRRLARRVEVDNLETLPEARGNETPRDLQRYEAADELNDVIVFLEERYPKGAQLLREERHQPDATPAELAAIMGISVDNYYQITRRRRTALSEYGRECRPWGRRG